MKIKNHYRAVRLFFLSIVLFSYFFNSFVFADDALVALQRDVLLAKEKQGAITQKLDSVELTFDQEKSKVLQGEADRLMRELTEKNENQKPKAEIKKQIEQELRIDAQKRPASSPVKAKIPAKASDFWKSYKINYKNVNLTEGRALYKVAVSDGKLSLREAVRVGMANRTELKVFAQKVEVAKSQLTEARRALFPTVQGVIENYRGLSGVVGLRTTGADAGNTDPHGRFFQGRSYKLNVSQPVFYDGELIHTSRQAEAKLKAAKAEYEKSKAEFIHQIKVSYYGVVKSEYNAQYQADLHEKVRDIYQQARRAHTEKVIPEIDYLNVESLAHQVYFQAESAQNDLLSAHLSLAQIIGMEENSTLPVDLKLNLLKTPVDLPTLIELAIQKNPDVQVKNFNFEAAVYGVKIFQAKKLPKVDLRGSIGLLGENFKDNRALFDEQKSELDLEKEWFLGLETSMPLGPNSVEFSQNKRVFGPTVIQLTGTEDRKTRMAFNLLDKFSQITDEKSAQAALLEAQSDLDKSKADVSSKVRENFYTLQKQMVQVDSSAAKIRYQEKQNLISEYMLGLQETTVANYVEGLIGVAESRFAFIQAVTENNLAISSLGLSIGDPDYFDTINENP